MSLDIPKLAIALGAVSPPQEDVIECKVHLGATKEVSSFEIFLKTNGLGSVLQTPGPIFPRFAGP